MSQLDEIKDSTHLLAETMQICEYNSLSPLNPPTAENSTAADTLQISKNTSDSFAGMGYVDEKAPTSRPVDPDNQDVLVELSHPSFEADDAYLVGQDPPKSVGEQSGDQSLGDLMSPYTISVRPGNGCFGCSTMVRKFKEKGFLIPFEIVCLVFTIACCFLGAYHWNMCPANVDLPRFVFFNGAVATLSVCMEITDSVWTCVVNRIRGYGELVGRGVWAFGIGWIALITTLVEMMEFYTMSYSFDRNEENYCNETFYWYVYYKNIVAAVLVSLVSMIYIPNFYFHYTLTFLA